MVCLEKQFRVKVSADRLWSFISDTERMNRASGLPPVQYNYQGNPSGPPHVTAKTKLGPMQMQWQEHPFEWVDKQYYRVRRLYDKGPLKVFQPGIRLAGENGVTDVHVSLEFEPRNVLGSWIARYLMWPKVQQKFGDLIRDMEAHLQDEKEPDPFWKVAPKGTVELDRLRVVGEKMKKRLAFLDECEDAQGSKCCALVERMIHHITKAPDIDVVAMRPFALADKWGHDRIDVLKMFLHATREGLLDLSWDLICPGCRKPNSSSCELKGVSCKAHCDYCQITYDAEFDRSIEARFSVHPSIRKVSKAEFCAGSPANTPHILAQVLVSAGQTKGITLPSVEVPLLVFSFQIPGHARLAVSDTEGEQRSKIVLNDKGMSTSSNKLHAGAVVLDLENHTDQDRWFLVKREPWDETAATAAKITSLQEFRDMFSADVLSPGTEIAVRNLTFMFTDLAGSTAVYHDLGDAKAYSLVREHFTVLKDAIAKRDGAVVKTIGDAVMAVFTDPRQGLRAATEMQNAIAKWNQTRGDQAPVVLKIGLHEGPAIAVNTDDVLDYFGTSVNLASRVEGQGKGGDIVISDDVMQAVKDDAVLETISEQKEQLTSPVKGFPDPVVAWRIWPKKGK